MNSWISKHQTDSGDVARNKKQPVECNNCGEVFSVTFQSKHPVTYCVFCGDEVLVADDDLEDDEFEEQEVYEEEPGEDE